MSSLESVMNGDGMCLLSVPNVGDEFVPICRYLLQLAPVPFVIEHILKLESWPSEECQNRLSKVIKCILKFPLSRKYMKYLTSCLSKTMDGNGDVFDDEFMELIIDVVGMTVDNTQLDSNVGYCGFLVGDTEVENGSRTSEYIIYNVIVIRIDKCHNQVGMKTWGAGIFLAEVLNNHPIILQGRRVIELGSGVGQTGLIACRKRPHHCVNGRDEDNFSPPIEMCMTDYTDDILRNLQHNVSINVGVDPRCIINCRTLDWNDCVLPQQDQKSPIIFKKYDVLLAADCTYSEDLCDILVSAIENFLMCEVSADRYALLAATIRSPETFQHLQNVISASTLIDVHDITAWSQTHSDMADSKDPVQFYCDFRENIRLYCVTTKGHCLPSYYNN